MRSILSFMPKKARKLIKQLTPIPAIAREKCANCFNAIQLYWADSAEAKFIGPEEFVTYVQANFSQLDPKDNSEPGDISIIWSRATTALPIGKIRIEDLRKDRVGYPFGLIIEHAFVSIGEGLIFQKRDPTESGPYEVVSERAAIDPYRSAFGFEISRHRRSEQ